MSSSLQAIFILRQSTYDIVKAANNSESCDTPLCIVRVYPKNEYLLMFGHKYMHHVCCSKAHFNAINSNITIDAYVVKSIRFRPSQINTEKLRTAFSQARKGSPVKSTPDITLIQQLYKEHSNYNISVKTAPLLNSTSSYGSHLTPKPGLSRSAAMVNAVKNSSSTKRSSPFPSYSPSSKKAKVESTLFPTSPNPNPKFESKLDVGSPLGSPVATTATIKSPITSPIKSSIKSQLLTPIKSPIQPSIKTPKTSGFVNSGNNCYINSILSLLLSSPLFVEYFKTDQYTLNSFPDDVAPVVKSLVGINQNFSSIKSRAIKSDQLRAMIGNYFQKYLSFVQQDAHEFLISLLYIIDQELIGVRKASISKDEFLSRCHGQNRSELARLCRTLKISHSFVTCGFKFSTVNQFKCQQCGNISTSRSTLMDLTLPIDSGSQSIEELIGRRFSTEVVEKRCGSQCSGTKAFKSEFFESCPNLFAICLKRISEFGVKNNSPVNIPKVLDITKFSSSDLYHVSKRDTVNLAFSPSEVFEYSQPCAMMPTSPSATLRGGGAVPRHQGQKRGQKRTKKESINTHGVKTNWNKKYKNSTKCCSPPPPQIKPRADTVSEALELREQAAVDTSHPAFSYRKVEDEDIESLYEPVTTVSTKLDDGYATGNKVLSRQRRAVLKHKARVIEQQTQKEEELRTEMEKKAKERLEWEQMFVKKEVKKESDLIDCDSVDDVIDDVIQTDQLPEHYPESEDLLDLGSQPINQNQPPVFNLVGVVCHNGVASEGHYICYTHNPQSTKWTLFDCLHNICEINLNEEAEEKMAKFGYLCLYEKKAF
ncbi:hypothetical protein P9112_010804 [Eukaryota sp. TZLM1-RC]